MVAPDAELLDRPDRLAALRGELRQSAVVVEAQHRREVLLRQRRRRLHRDVGVRVRRVADDQHLDVAGGDPVERLALFDEDLRVLHQQILALHPGPAGLGADEQRDVGVLERDGRVRRAFHAGEERKRAVLDLHHHALERRLRLFDRQLEELQDDRLVLAEHLAGGDPEQQAVADLAGGAGDGDANGLLHGGLLVTLGQASGRRRGVGRSGGRDAGSRIVATRQRPGTSPEHAATALGIEPNCRRQASAVSIKSYIL